MLVTDTDTDKLDELRECFLSMLKSGNELGISVHPLHVDLMFRMADILGVETDLIPTEGKVLSAINQERRERTAKKDEE